MLRRAEALDGGAPAPGRARPAGRHRPAQPLPAQPGDATRPPGRPARRRPALGPRCATAAAGLPFRATAFDRFLAAVARQPRRCRRSTLRRSGGERADRRRPPRRRCSPGRAARSGASRPRPAWPTRAALERRRRAARPARRAVPGREAGDGAPARRLCPRHAGLGAGRRRSCVLGLLASGWRGIARRRWRSRHRSAARCWSRWPCWPLRGRRSACSTWPRCCCSPGWRSTILCSSPRTMRRPE